MEDTKKVTVYATTEQIHRLAGLACDAMAGIQFDTTDSMDSSLVGCFVHIDTAELQFFCIDPDGSVNLTT